MTDCYDLFATLLIDAEHVHAWTEWEITAEPTKEEPGEKQHKCLICGEVETAEIPATAPSTEPTEPEATQKPTEKPGTGDNVQTGDGVMGSLWTVMLIISMAGVAVLVTFRKKWMA